MAATQSNQELDKHFLVGIFDDEDVLLHGVEKVRKKGVIIHEVFTPYPIHGLEHALGYKPSWLPKAAFMFGATGTTLALVMQIGMSGISWPMIIGGKPFIAFPDFIPVSFEMTVLFSAFGMVGSFLVSQDLKPYKVPRIFDRRSTDHKHVMAIDLVKNSSKSQAELEAILKEAGAEEIYPKSFTEEENNPSFFKYVSDLFRNGVGTTSRPLK
jgi:hypothetical protein